MARHSCAESVQYVRTLIPQWGDGGCLRGALPFQHVCLSVDEGDFSPAGVEVYAGERGF